MKKMLSMVLSASMVLSLAACGGNRTRAARELGMDRTTLWRKLQKYIQK